MTWPKTFARNTPPLARDGSEESVSPEKCAGNGENFLRAKQKTVFRVE